MKMTVLPGTTLTCSRFVFGTASLMRAGGRPQRRRLLDAAVDHGFTHFDTAPLYGFGAAERDLAYLLRTHPHLTVTTKLGLYPPGGGDQAEPVVFARKLAGKAVPALSRPVRDFDLRRAQRSLEASLRRLGRDHVELLLLHEPAVEMIEPDAWVAWLLGRRQAGQIGGFGLALPAPLLRGFIRAGSPLLETVQTMDSLDRCEADILTEAGRPLQLTYGYVSAARERGESADVATVLRRALERNRTGAILVTTNRTDRMAQYPRLLEDAA